MNPLIAVALVHRKEYLWYQKPPRHLFILILKKIFPKGHVNVLQGLPDQLQPERQAAAGCGCSTPDCLQTVNQTLPRSLLSNPWRSEHRIRQLQPHHAYGKHWGLRRLGMSGRWPRQSMEPCTLILTPESLSLTLNENKWTMIVDYSAASWPVVGTVTGTHTDPCCTVMWSTEVHSERSEGIWQGVKPHPSLCYVNIHIPLICSLIQLKSKTSQRIPAMTWIVRLFHEWV